MRYRILNLGLTMLILTGILSPGRIGVADALASNGSLGGSAMASSQIQATTDIASQFPSGVSVQSLVETVTDEIPDPPVVFRLDRFRFGPGHVSEPGPSPGPILVYVESGHLTIVDELGIEGIYPADTRLVIPMGVVVSLRNDESHPVDILLLGLYPSGNEPAENPDPNIPLASQATPIAGASPHGLLLRSELERSIAPMRLFLARVTWDPGADLGYNSFAGPIGIIGETGILSISGPSGIEGQLRPGRSVLFPPETPNRQRNVDEEDAVILMAGAFPADQALFSDAPAAAGGAISIATAELTSTPEPAPSPTMVAAGVILYEATESGGFDEWELAQGWQLYQGVLLNDGTTSSSMLAPFYPPTTEYAVEAEIQLVWSYHRSCPDFGLASHDLRVTGGWGSNGMFCGMGVLWVGSMRNSSNIDPDFNWHTYRIEVKGNRARLLVDGMVITEISDNQLIGSSPGAAGVWVGANTQVILRSFRVISL